MPTSPITRVRFAAPDDWYDFSAISLVAPDGAEFSANLMVTHEPWTGAMSEYATAQAEAAKREMQDYKRIALAPVQTGGLEGMCLEHVFTADEGEHRLRQVQIFVGASGVAFTVSLTHLDSAFDSVRPVLERTLASLQIE